MSVESQAVGAGRRRSRRTGRARLLREDRAARPAGDDTLDELRAELVLLREENATLKAASHGRSDVGALMQSARSLSLAVATPAPAAHDDPRDAMIESLLLREALLEACREITLAMSAIEERLRAFAPDDAAALKPSRHLMAAEDAAMAADAAVSLRTA